VSSRKKKQKVNCRVPPWLVGVSSHRKKNTSNTSKFIIIYYRQLLIERKNTFHCTSELE